MEVVIAKVIAMIILLVTTLLLGIIPYFIVKRDGSDLSPLREKILGFLNCLAGGVFLGTSLLHLLVEGKEDLETVLLERYNYTGFPVFETLVGSGFFIIALLEQLASMCMVGIVAKSVRVKPVFHLNEGSYNQFKQSTGHAEVVGNIEDLEGRSRPLSRKSETERSISHTHGFEGVSHPFDLRAFILLIALSFHTIFDGLAVGLQVSDKDVWEVFVAISIHKSLVAFCLGLQLFRAYHPGFKKAFGCLFLFSLMSPIGIGIGIGLTSSSFDETAQKLTSGVLQGIACGTFLFVTCFEILKDELAHKSNIFKVLVAAVGFGAMAAVKALDKD